MSLRPLPRIIYLFTPHGYNPGPPPHLTAYLPPWLGPTYCRPPTPTSPWPSSWFLHYITVFISDIHWPRVALHAPNLFSLRSPRSSRSSSKFKLMPALLRPRHSLTFRPRPSSKRGVRLALNFCPGWFQHQWSHFIGRLQSAIPYHWWRYHHSRPECTHGKGRPSERLPPLPCSPTWLAPPAWVWSGATSFSLTHVSHSAYARHPSSSTSYLLADALQSCLRIHFNIHDSFHYLDDFFAGQPNSTMHMQQGYILLPVAMPTTWGPPEAGKTIVLPTTCMTFLGIQLDSAIHRLLVYPPEKMDSLLLSTSISLPSAGN